MTFRTALLLGVVALACSGRVLNMQSYPGEFRIINLKPDTPVVNVTSEMVTSSGSISQVKCTLQYKLTGSSAAPTIVDLARLGTSNTTFALVDIKAFFFTSAAPEVELSLRCIDADEDQAKGGMTANSTLRLGNCSQLTQHQCVASSVETSMCKQCGIVCVRASEAPASGCSTCGNGILELGEDCEAGADCLTPAGAGAAKGSCRCKAGLKADCTNMSQCIPADVFLTVNLKGCNSDPECAHGELAKKIAASCAREMVGIKVTFECETAPDRVSAIGSQVFRLSLMPGSQHAPADAMGSADIKACILAGTQPAVVSADTGIKWSFERTCQDAGILEDACPAAAYASHESSSQSGGAVHFISGNGAAQAASALSAALALAVPALMAL